MYYFNQSESLFLFIVECFYIKHLIEYSIDKNKKYLINAVQRVHTYIRNYIIIILDEMLAHLFLIKPSSLTRIIYTSVLHLYSFMIPCIFLFIPEMAQ